jgi:uncharacterized delta-60 repeat protein
LRRIAFALVLATATSVTLLVLQPATAAPGDLDTTFGSEGIVETPIGTSAHATAVLVQPDARVVAGGTRSIRAGNTFESSFAVARYLPDGQLDTGFGSGGVATGPCCGASALALQPDGKIVQSGNGFHDNRARFVLARYRPDGSLDSTFGSGGALIGPEGGARDVDVQADGKIVAAGTETDSYAFKLVRFNPDGSLDSSFGVGGSVRTLLGSKASAEAVAVLPDGKIVAAGISVPGNPPPPPPPPPAPPPPPPPGPPPDPRQLTVVRYNPDGSLDSSFGLSGAVKTALGYSATVEDLAIQPDGKLVVTGHTEERIFRPSSVALARYQADGALDPAFGSGGIAITKVDPGNVAPGASGAAVTVQPDGRIVVGGTFGVARYRADGKLDSTFGSGGFSRASRSVLSPASVVLQPDGRIVTAGSRSGAFALNRYFARSVTTIGSAPRPVRYGRATVVQGRLANGQAGIRVEILKRGCYEFRPRVAATATTQAGGRWHTRMRLASAATVQAKIGPETSSPLVVPVRPRVTLSKLGAKRFRARVFAARSLGGRILVLQQLSKSRWVDRQRIVLRRIVKRGVTVVSGSTFSRGNTAGKRLRLVYRDRNSYACYASAASGPITG